jgi:hypothetical protein
MIGRLRLTASTLVLATLPAASFAAPGPSIARVSAVLGDASALMGVSVPQFGAFTAPLPAPPPKPVGPNWVRVNAWSLQPSASLVPAGLWAGLPQPDAATISWLGSRVPGLDPSAVRQMTETGAETVFSAAAARGANGLELFTDAGFRGREVYYLPGDLVATMFSRYLMHTLTPATGVDTNGKPFRMQGLLIGGGKIVVLYDRAVSEFHNPDFNDGTYTVAQTVSQTIAGPGDIIINGVQIHVKVIFGIHVTAVIQRITQTAHDKAIVKTDHGDREKPLHPVVRR